MNDWFLDAALFDDNLALFDDDCGSPPATLNRGGRLRPSSIGVAFLYKEVRDLRAPIRATVLDDIPARRRFWSILLCFERFTRCRLRLSASRRS
jgi:hypothetical protein